MKKWLIGILLAAFCLFAGCQPQETPVERAWSAGFGVATLELPADSEQPLYIAGYHNGWQITGVLDLQQARALWLDDGATSLLLIAVDCVGLDSGTVAQIRQELAGFCRETGCDSVNVVSTHSHAGVDTLGLWGPVAISGKNEDFMQILIRGAVAAAKDAYADRCRGTLHYVATPTEALQEDSRDPQVYDTNIYQLRFQPEDSEKNGIRLISFAAHAEALRGDNTLVSRDYPGAVCDIVTAETGDDALYVPGAIGGLIMTPRLKEDPVENLQVTAQRIANRVLAAKQGRELPPGIDLSRVEFETELDNTLFQYYKFLGILGNPVEQNLSGAYMLSTELTLIRLGDVTLALLPGELFPELVSGTGAEEDPPALKALAKDYGVEDLVIIGLANDEIGYILPPSDFVLDESLPYLQEAEGDHYEETNSVGPDCARDLADAFMQALKDLHRN